MKRYILATALALILGSVQAKAQTAPCAAEATYMNKQCGTTGTTVGCENAIRQYGACLTGLAGPIQACQQQSQTVQFSCVTIPNPSPQTCPGQLQQLSTCIAGAQAPPPPPPPGPPGPNANPQSDYHGNGQSDYRLGCPYLQSDGPAKTAVKCRGLSSPPSPAPY